VQTTLPLVFRELSRILLDDLAPDASVKACGWYKQEFNQDGAPVITRGQRVRYAVQAGLLNDFVTKTLHANVDKTVKQFNQQIKRFNALTHITPSTFGMSKTAAQAFANESLGVFISLFETIDKCRDSVVEALESLSERCYYRRAHILFSQCTRMKLRRTIPSTAPGLSK
jgi:hypothetical protein